MIAVVTLLAAFPLGWFLQRRSAAATAYTLAYLWAFVFQTLYLLLHSLGPDPAADGEVAFVPGSFPLSYGVATLAVLAVGLALIELGHRARARWRPAPVR